MNTTHILFACVAFGLFLFAGCASINSSNYEDRMTAVRAIESEDELMTAFHETNYEDVRQIIIERLKSEDKLVEIAFNSNESPTLRKSAALKFQSDTNLFNVVTEPSFSQPLRSWAANQIQGKRFLRKIALCESLNIEARFNALLAISDEEMFVEAMSWNGLDEDQRLVISQRITSEARLVVIATNSILPMSVRTQAARRLKEESSLQRIIIDGSLDSETRFSALCKITDEQFLKKALCWSWLNEWQSRQLLAKIENSDLLCEIAMDKRLNERVRLVAAGRLNESNACKKVFMTASDYSIRSVVLHQIPKQMSANDVEMQKTLEAFFMNNLPQLVRDNETVLRAVLSHITRQEFLLTTLNDKRIGLSTRIATAQRLTDPDSLRRLLLQKDAEPDLQEQALKKLQGEIKTLESIFHDGVNDYVLRRLFAILPVDRFKAKEAQKKLEYYFTNVNDPRLAIEILGRFDREYDLSAEQLQRRIASLLTVDSSARVKKLVRNFLFSPEVIEDLVLQNLQVSHDVALWSIDLIANDVGLKRLIERSSDDEIKAHVVSRIESESILAQIAEDKKESVIVRINSILHLGKDSKFVLQRLSQDTNLNIAKSALKALSRLGVTDIRHAQKELGQRVAIERAAEKKRRMDFDMMMLKKREQFAKDESKLKQDLANGETEDSEQAYRDSKKMFDLIDEKIDNFLYNKGNITYECVVEAIETHWFSDDEVTVIMVGPYGISKPKRFQVNSASDGGYKVGVRKKVHVNEGVLRLD